MILGCKQKYDALSLSVVPLKNPVYGGSIRISEALAIYRKIGLNVLPICIAANHMMQADLIYPQDILFPDNECKKIRNRYGGKAGGCESCLADDFFSGIYAQESNEILRMIENYFTQKCKVIFLEGPWFYGLAKKLLELPQFKNAKLIYSSLNIEYRTKKAIFESYGIENEEVIKDIYKIESELLKESDLTICVSKEDKEHFLKLGVKKCIVASNGTARPLEFPKFSYQRLKGRKFLRQALQPYPLFVASSYFPNVIGFLFFFGKNLGCLTPDIIIHIAGSLSHALALELIERNKIYSQINNHHLKFFGVLERHNLDLLKQSAHMLLLPITIGGGSNLKTAEAIFSGKYILSSSFAFRGYEEFKNLPGVFIEDDPIKYRDKLTEILKMEPLEKLNKENCYELRSKVLWENTLSPAVSALKELLNII